MTKNTRGILVVIVVVLAAIGAGLLSAQGGSSFQVVVHVDNPTDSMSRSEVSALFLKKRTRWEFGSRPSVQPVDQPTGAQIHDDFCRQIHHRSAAAVRSFWQQRIFSGRAVPPPEAVSDAEVVDFVSKDIGGIGYVAKAAVVSQVKVLRVTE